MIFIMVFSWFHRGIFVNLMQSGSEPSAGATSIVGYVVIVILIAAVVIGIILYVEHLRKEFWRELARAWKFRYYHGDPHDIPNNYPFQLFDQGHQRRVKHLIEGEERGRLMLMFDYHYKTGSGKSQQHHELSALIVEIPIIGMRLTVRPENTFDRFAAFFGFEDINFELEAFNRAFQVHCESKKFAYDVFHPRMMEFMLQHRELALEWCGEALLIYFYRQKKFDRDDAYAIKKIAHRFIDLLPEYLNRT